jgi:hypothetical protein
MRLGFLIALLVLALAAHTCQRAQPVPATISSSGFSKSPTLPSTTSSIDFDKQIKPILQRCAPCHFPGGKVYEKLPFDRPETITKLGTKLFTRIKDEKEQQLIREFLGQP